MLLSINSLTTILFQATLASESCNVPTTNSKMAVSRIKVTKENVVKTLRGVRVPPVLTYIENITNIMIGRDIVKYDRLIPLIMEAFIIIHTSDLIERKKNIFHLIKKSLVYTKIDTIHDVTIEMGCTCINYCDNINNMTNVSGNQKAIILLKPIGPSFPTG